MRIYGKTEQKNANKKSVYVYFKVLCGVTDKYYNTLK